MKIKRFIGVVAIVGSMLMASTSMAGAAVELNDDGTGFVGKGDVQLVYGWNNKQLQDNADMVQFRSTIVSERSWECTNSKNQRVLERERTTTTTQVVSKVDRVRNQITGFILSGYTGPAVTSTEGPPLNSCPSGFWSLTSPAGDPVVLGSSLQVSIDGTNWINL